MRDWNKLAVFLFVLAGIALIIAVVKQRKNNTAAVGLPIPPLAKGDSIITISPIES